MTWRDVLPSVRGRLLRDEPLGPFTWFRVGGNADVLCLPAAADDLAAFLKALHSNFMINPGEATAADIEGPGETVREIKGIGRAA